MSTTKRILVPLDFSECSATAARMAEELARAVGAELVFLHVVDPRPYLLVDVAGYAPAYDLGQLEEAGARTLEEWAAKTEKSGVAVSRKVLHGFPAQGILEATESSGADLVVMGTHGRRGFRHLLLGSVTERVVRTSKVPVMTTCAHARSAP